MTKHTFSQASVTGDTRGLARAALGYDWNYLVDDETFIFGTDSDATIGWDATNASLRLSGPVTLGAVNGLELTSITATSGTIPVTAATNTDLEIGAQPAGTIIKDFYLINAGAIVTAGTTGDDFDISVGTAAGGAQLLAATALLDDGGSAVTWAANTPLNIFKDGADQAANGFAAATAGTGIIGGPATTEAIVAAASLYTATARTLHIRFTPLANDLTTAATTVKAIVVFQYL